MRHEELLELADVYALGALEGEELKEFEGHLSSGCAQCRGRLRDSGAVLTLLAGACEPLLPPSDAKTKIFEQIEADKPNFTFTFAHEGVWHTIAAGVRAKVLNLDPERQRITALLRMDPGSRYDNHRHTRTEELVIIEGSCYCGGKFLQKGDYHRAEAGSIHLDTRTDEGSLMLVITSVQNEMIA